MRLTLVTPPAKDAISLHQAKAHCRVDHGDDDFLIPNLIAGAVNYLDGPSGILGRAIMPQTWALELPSWPDAIALPVEPVRSVSVTYVSAAGVSETLSSDSYELVQWPSRAPRWQFVDGAQRPALGDVTYPITITMEAGAASVSEVDDGIKIAILMLVGHWYENREAVAPVAVTELPMAVDALLARHRRVL
jgi:uncharacterized phiE125 gp8 family phage protein